jgi:dolichyl-phosphate mannosyltransferase polypeptide 3
MTKLQEWLAALALGLALWAAAYTGLLLPHYRAEVLWSPVLLVLLLGLYSVLTIAYRTATFNDCEAASQELQGQIGEAREDLRSKGFNFD